MKQRGSTQGKLLRATQVALASAAFALLAACGGGSDNNNSANNTPPGGVNLQVVSFGDSLSDVGTYAPNVAIEFGGGRFTTNPGEVWTQKVAEYYGGTLTAAVQGGFGMAPVNTAGLGYAQGGSDVVEPEGEGWAANNAAALTYPVVTQVANYVTQHGTFNSNQLVLVNGGANDIFQKAASLTPQLLQAIAALPPGATQTQQVMAAIGVIQPTQIGIAAGTLAATVRQIVGNGATHVVVSNVPDIGQTNLGYTSGAQGAAGLTLITAAYNAILQSQIADLIAAKKVIYVDAFGWLDTVIAGAQSYGFTVTNTATACNLAQMAQNAQKAGEPNPTDFATSLFCSPSLLVAANADQTYMFADQVHPTTHLHALFAQYVQQQIATSGLGK